MNIDCGCFGGGGYDPDASSKYPLEIAARRRPAPALGVPRLARPDEARPRRPALPTPRGRARGSARRSPVQPHGSLNDGHLQGEAATARREGGRAAQGEGAPRAAPPDPHHPRRARPHRRADRRRLPHQLLPRRQRLGRVVRAGRRQRARPDRRRRLRAARGGRLRGLPLPDLRRVREGRPRGARSSSPTTARCRSSTARSPCSPGSAPTPRCRPACGVRCWRTTVRTSRWRSTTPCSRTSRARRARSPTSPTWSSWPVSPAPTPTRSRPRWTTAAGEDWAKAATESASESGVNSTPTVLLDGELFTDYRTPDDFGSQPRSRLFSDPMTRRGAGPARSVHPGPAQGRAARPPRRLGLGPDRQRARQPGTPARSRATSRSSSGSTSSATSRTSSRSTSRWSR